MAVNDRTRDGRPILTRAILEDWDPRPRRAGRWTCFRCPEHESDHQKSLHVDEEGHYRCHACGISGRLREFWEEKEGNATEQSMEERGRALRAARAREDQRKRDDFARDLPPEARAFLAELPAYREALRDPACPGHAYLRGRGLDPLLAADHGAGYCAPGVFPGDGGRKVGRVVYPLADPTTGRVVSAMGRLCVDPTPDWAPPALEQFKRAKQRKLRDCPSAVWPYQALDRARAQRRPLVLMEGPADALALLQASTLPAVAQCGTAQVIPAAAFAGTLRLVIAFDDDEPGRAAARSLRADYLLDLVATLPAAGWLQGAKDLAALAAGGDESYARAIAALRESALPWDEGLALGVIAASVERCSAAARGLPPGACPLHDDEAIDAAWGERDWEALHASVEGAERAFLDALEKRVS